MKATSKRLLSWLVVLTMVLSMVPVMDLSNFAITTKAAENPAQDTLTAIEGMEETFAGQTETVSAICPVCGGEEAVEWTALTGAAAQLADPNGHYYLSGDVTFSAAGTSFSSNNNTLCLYLNGNDITAGGVAIQVTYGNTVNIMGEGTVSGTASSNGAALNVNNPNGKINIYGGTFQKVAGAKGAVAAIGAQGGVINMYTGTIDASGTESDAWATTISMMGAAGAKNAIFNLYGGDVKCGTITKLSGNYLGNINIGYTVTYAGGAEFNMYGGTVSGGTHTAASGVVGGNFSVTNGNYLNVYGGTIYGGRTGVNGANISIRSGEGNVHIAGGTIVGDIYLPATGSLKLSGAPKIVTSLEIGGETVTAEKGGIHVTGDSKVDISELTTDAEIWVTGSKGAAFTAAHENAANVVESFNSTNTALDIFVTDGNQLWFNDKQVQQPVWGDFDPENCGGMAYCEACGEAAGAQEWTAITGTGLSALSNPNGHYYLSGDATFTAAGTSFSSNSNTLCLNLNGKTMTAGGVAIQVTYGNTVNIMGEGTVFGTASSNGAALNVNNPNAKVNIYGGTFKKVDGAKGAVAAIGAQGGVINMHAGTIDASGTESDSWATTISMMGAAGAKNAIFNLYGGDIKCGTITKLSGNYLGNINIGYTVTYAGGAEFNMYGGTVSGGTHTADSGVVGGNFSVTNGNTLNVYGGTIYGGRTGTWGANISVRSGEGNVNISGGTIVGDVCVATTGSISLSGNAKIVKELTIGEETVTAEMSGVYVRTDDLVDITGLTAEADVYITGAMDVALTTGEGDTTGIKAYEADKYAETVEGVVYLRKAPVVVVTGEEQVGYANAADALAAYYAIESNEKYLLLNADAELLELTDDVYIDANGYTVLVNGTGKLYAMDSSNDDYDGCGMWIVIGEVEVVKDVVNPVNGNRYILIKNEDETYGAHRIEMDVTHVTLSTANAGVYFKSEYKCDDVLAAHVGDYGVILSVDGGAEIASVMEVAFAPNEEHTVSGASTEVYGIFKSEGRTNEENAAIGETVICAVPYITVDGEKIGENTSVQMSLLDVMEKIDAAWNNDTGFVLTEEEKAQAQALYATWKDLGMSAWAEKLPNISAEA